MIELEKLKKEAKELLFNKYGTLVLSRQQAAESVNRSVATLDRWKIQGLYLEYKKIGISKNAHIQYPIDTIVDYICENNIKII